ncbi:glycerol-3-phosphate responsive antiterminator [Paenibacillus sp. ACRRX]|uniref:glycerol-3-phosphate responsive antiterminator n=1 Tax=unclassified Paenibacillus TaxID=185978 RepID=UPI001EF6BB22|nr:MULTISPECIES: glycerol-3-phosphate responsive antiterminator [unclassified Paenibacillus]MCG7409245.1 glycerol-3-phosphate responsive antiterminator [Paenibacillus sp. ACRRX]MDK8179900.1 glycerol-3-phosphate responsive antiterminator [Paenibacillus sp. UMB4589-SE434]
MDFYQQRILPASRQMKDLEKAVASSFEYLVLLDMHVAQLKHACQMVHRANKKLFLHIDLIQGLQNDAYATEYLCQEYRPYGILSTKASVIQKAKQKGVVAVQRIFLIDNSALEKSFKLLQNTQPDVIEVLPGGMPNVIRKVKQSTNLPILAGGFISTSEDVEQALQAGAEAVTTSNKQLWTLYEKK